MARVAKEETTNTGFVLPDNDMEELQLIEVPKEEDTYTERKSSRRVRETYDDSKELVNCLRKERIIVRLIPKERGSITNPKHLLYGGMSESALIYFGVPRLASGVLVNVLTDSEKAYLEHIMGLEIGALSIYKKVDNYWDDSNNSGISRVRLTKQDNYLDLSIPEDYIKYKILLANKDYIAPSIKTLQDSPKETYKFVIVAEGEETKTAKENLSSTMQCYKEFGKIEDDIHTLRTIIELIDGRPTAPTSKLDFLQTKINNLIQADSKLFLRVISDSTLTTKVLIKRCIEAGLIANRGNHLYLKRDNTPLCEYNEEPTLSIASRFLSAPKNQELKFYLESKLKQ